MILDNIPSHLSPFSHKKIHIKCDGCGTPQLREIREINNSYLIHGCCKDFCRSCGNKYRGQNVGDKNGMKKLEARQKVSDFRKNMFKDPNERQRVSREITKA